MLLGSCREMKASEKKCTTNLVPLYDAKQADVISKIEGIGYISNTSIVDAIDADYSDEYHSDESMDGIDINGDDCDDSDDDVIEIKDEEEASAEFEEEDPDYDDDYETKIDIDPDFPKSVLEEVEAVHLKVKTLNESEKDKAQVGIDREKLELPDLGEAKAEVNELPLLEDVASNDCYQNGMPVLEDVELDDWVRRSARVTKPTSYNSMDEDEEEFDTEMPPMKRPYTKRSSLPKKNPPKLTYTSIVRTSDADFPYKCHVCSKGFKLKQILVSHLKIHKLQNHPLLQTQAFPTSEALPKPIKTKSTTELIRVIQVTTPKSGSLRDRFRCNYCDKRFIEKITLLVHLNEHVEYKTDAKIGKAGYTELAEEENGSAKENGTSKGPDQPVEKCPSKKPVRSKEESLSSKLKTKKRKRCEEEKDLTFRCDECPRWYRNEQDLEKHRSSHLGEKKFQCDVCFRTFKSDNFLNDHRKLHSVESQKVNCLHCNESFNEAALKEHQELYCKAKQCECQLCGRRFVRSDELEAHLTQHAEHVGNAATCTTCTKSFVSKEEMEEHQRTCGSYECHLCKAKKVSERALDRHMRKVHSRRSGLEEEIRITTVFYRQCSVCDVKFTLKNLFAQHMRSHFSRVKINFTGNFVTMRQLDFKGTDLGHEYKCYICLKPATSFTVMADHVVEHRSQIPMECCNIRFLNFEQLVKHKRAHMVILNCTKCDCMFYTTLSLQDHQAVHKNPTSKCMSCSETKGTYKCNICKCMFDSFESWEKHVQHHRNDQPVLDARKLPELTASDVNNLKSALEYIRNAQTTVEKESSAELLQCKFCERGFRSLVDLYDHRSVHLNSSKKSPQQNCEEGAGKSKRKKSKRGKRGGVRRRMPKSVRDSLKEDGVKEDSLKEDAISSALQQT